MTNGVKGERNMWQRADWGWIWCLLLSHRARPRPAETWCGDGTRGRTQGPARPQLPSPLEEVASLHRLGKKAARTQNPAPGCRGPGLPAKGRGKTPPELTAAPPVGTGRALSRCWELSALRPTPSQLGVEAEAGQEPTQFSRLSGPGFGEDVGWGEVVWLAGS